MLPISEGSHDTWNFYWSSVAPVTTQTVPNARDEESFSARNIAVGISSVPRTTSSIVCSQKIKSIFERVLLTVTDFFSCSVTRVTRRIAIEQDLNQLLHSPHKMRQGDWDVVFNKRCAEARWYGVDVDNVLHQAFVNMESKAAIDLKSVCCNRDSLNWLKPAVLARDKKQNEAAQQLTDILNAGSKKASSPDNGEFGKVLQDAIGAGCNIYSIVERLMAVDGLHAFRLLQQALKHQGLSPFIFKAAGEAVCRKLLSDDEVFDGLLAELDEKGIGEIFGMLDPYLSGTSAEKAKIIHMTWVAKNHLENLDAPGASDPAHAKFERFISASGYNEFEIRRIFSLAAGKCAKAATTAADRSVDSLNEYDKWLIDARRASSLSDDELVTAFDNGLYNLPTQELGISRGDMAVLKAEAHRRAETSETDSVATLKSAVTNSILLDSVWYLLPAVLVAKRHNARMEKFQKLAGYTPRNDWSRVVESMFPADRKRIIQSLKYLSGKLKSCGEAEAGRFLAALLPQLGSFKNAGVLRKNDRRTIAGMLARHLGNGPDRKSDFKFESFPLLN